MAISKEQLASIISGRAAQLCSPEGSRLIENHTSKQSMYSDFNNPDSKPPARVRAILADYRNEAECSLLAKGKNAKAD